MRSPTVDLSIICMFNTKRCQLSEQCHEDQLHIFDFDSYSNLEAFTGSGIDRSSIELLFPFLVLSQYCSWKISGLLEIKCCSNVKSTISCLCIDPGGDGLLVSVFNLEHSPGFTEKTFLGSIFGTDLNLKVPRFQHENIQYMVCTLLASDLFRVKLELDVCMMFFVLKYWQ